MLEHREGSLRVGQSVLLYTEGELEEVLVLDILPENRVRVFGLGDSLSVIPVEEIFCYLDGPTDCETEDKSNVLLEVEPVEGGFSPYKGIKSEGHRIQFRTVMDGAEIDVGGYVVGVKSRGFKNVYIVTELGSSAFERYWLVPSQNILE
tara:strand:+ start:126 stop:572 length:447 start_codon:yes stop_codon:yes gene_type:complete